MLPKYCSLCFKLGHESKGCRSQDSDQVGGTSAAAVLGASVNAVVRAMYAGAVASTAEANDCAATAVTPTVDPAAAVSSMNVCAASLAVPIVAEATLNECAAAVVTPVADFPAAASKSAAVELSSVAAIAANLDASGSSSAMSGDGDILNLGSCAGVLSSSAAATSGVLAADATPVTVSADGVLAPASLLLLT